MCHRAIYTFTDAEPHLYDSYRICSETIRATRKIVLVSASWSEQEKGYLFPLINLTTCYEDMSIKLFYKQRIRLIIQSRGSPTICLWDPSMKNLLIRVLIAVWKV